jgi:hypothetical protein
VLALYTLARGAQKHLVKHASEAEIRSRTRTVRMEVWEFLKSDRDGARLSPVTPPCHSMHL